MASTWPARTVILVPYGESSDSENEEEKCSPPEESSNRPSPPPSEKRKSRRFWHTSLLPSHRSTCWSTKGARARCHTSTDNGLHISISHWRCAMRCVDRERRDGGHKERDLACATGRGFLCEPYLPVTRPFSLRARSLGDEACCEGCR